MIRFCLALASVAFWPQLPAPWWWWLCLVVALLGLPFKLLRPLLPICLGLAWGLGAGYWLLGHRLPDSWQGVDLVARGTIVGLPERQGERCRFDLVLDQLIAPDASRQPLLLPRTLRLSQYRCVQAPAPGQRWQLVVRLKRAHGFVNPAGFDYGLYLLSRGIDASGYVRDGGSTRLDDAVLAGSIDRWRSQAVEVVQRQSMPAAVEPQVKGLLAALLVGDKRGLDDGMWQILRDSGTAHLFVVSGLHVGMVAGFCYGLVFWLGRLRPQWRYRYRVVAAALCAMVGSGGYALLAGFALPTQRAWVMVCAVMLSLIGWRAMTPAQRLWLAATAVLIVEPLAVRQAGFWLSFGACAVLIYAFAGHLARIRPLRQLLWAQLAIALGLTPWLLFTFYQWPPLAPLINLVAIPVVTLLLPVLLLSLVLLGLWPAAGTWLLSLMAPLLAWGWQGLSWSAQQLQPLSIAGPVSLWAVLLAVGGAMLLLLPRSVPGRWLGLLLWLPLLLPPTSELKPGAFRATVLDVGQGLSVLIETQQHRLLYDSGPRYRSGFNAADAAIVPYLRSRGIGQLDRLLISHADSDHAGGQAVIEQQLQVDQTLTGSARIAADGLCRSGQQWRWDGVTFALLHPTGRFTANENNRSCVLLIENGQQRLLLTGDIEAVVERQLVERYAGQLRADYLVAGHHGSRSSTSAGFLAQVDPDQVFISSGWRNRFGHPHTEVVQRITAQGRGMLNTATDGAIQLLSQPGAPAEITTAINRRWGYWRRPLLDDAERDQGDRFESIDR